jgi:hypothetical protein
LENSPPLNTGREKGGKLVGEIAELISTMKKIYLTDTSCRERGDKIDARGVNGEFDAEINSIWDQIDHALADLKIKKPYHEFLEAVDNRAPYEKFMEAVRHEVTSDKEGLIIGCEQLMSRKEYEEIGLSTYIEKVCTIYREVWKLQGKEFSANFVRTIYQNAVVPQLNQCRDEVNSVCKEYFSTDLNDLHSHSFLILEFESIHRREIDYRLGVGLWQRFFSDYVDSLKEEWLIKCEIAARELEYATTINGDDSIGHSQSRQMEPTANLVNPELTYAASQDTKKQNLPLFSNLSNMQWDEVKIIFVSDDTVRMCARSERKLYHFASIGFQDARKGDGPNILWGLLLALAHYGGTIPTNNDLDARLTRNLPKHKQRLQEHLKSLFGIEDDPFYDYQHASCYKTKFEIQKANAIDLLNEEDIHPKTGNDVE